MRIYIQAFDCIDLYSLFKKLLNHKNLVIKSNMSYLFLKWPKTLSKRIQKHLYKSICILLGKGLAKNSGLWPGLVYTFYTVSGQPSVCDIPFLYRSISWLGERSRCRISISGVSLFEASTFFAFSLASDLNACASISIFGVPLAGSKALSPVKRCHCW